MHADSAHPDTRQSVAHAAPVLASDAEREELVERLRVATGEGRLTLEELAERCEAAYLARTRAQLALIGEDLPALGPQPATDRGPSTFRAVIGDITHRSPVAPASGRIEATAVLGDLTLDLCHSPVPATGVLTIVARAIAGDVRLIVPEGVATDLTCTNVLGDIRDHTRGHSAPSGSAPTLHITGSAILGDIIVTHPATTTHSPWRKWFEGLGARL